jgi:GDP-L-fucose synthase
MDKQSKIYVAGHRGLVGSALLRALQKDGYKNLITRTRQELDLLNSSAVADFFKKEKPEFVLYAAAKVGGIGANHTYPADFIYQNLAIQNNVIHNSYLNRVQKLLFLGSVCIYPKFAEQPVKEASFLTGELEPTNRAYAVAKIAGVVMCQSYNKQYGTDYISIMPTNLYGPNDNFDLEESHVLPALLRKFDEAKQKEAGEVVLWGTGKPRREFMYSDDMANACLFLMNNYNSSDIINIGAGRDYAIKEVAEMLQEIVGFKGKIVWDTSKPDGTPARLMDNSRLKNMGWTPSIELAEGLKLAYDWYRNNFRS